MSPCVYRPPIARMWCAAACLGLMIGLTGCGKKGTATETPPEPQPPAAAPGSLDVADDVQLGGWAWNPQQPNARLKIDLYDGETKLQTVVADQSREDLVRAKIGDGKYAFSLPTPESLKDGKPHTIRAVVSGTKIELNGSPKRLVVKRP